MRPTEELVEMGIVEIMPDGTLKILNREAFFSLPEIRFPLILAEAYLDFHSLAVGTILSDQESERLVALFGSWMAESGDVKDLEEQYRTLGIMDIKGELNAECLRNVAWKVFELEDQTPDFNLLLNHLKAQSTS